jgi:superfamily I DNA/RNA helicase
MMIAEKLVHLGYGRERIKVGVYTKNNKNDLISKFGKQWENSISTFHSVGYKMLLDFLSVKNLHLDENKYYKISHELDIFSNFQDPVMKATKLRTFVKLIDMLRLNLGSEKSLEELAAFHCLDVELTLTDDLRQRVSQVLSSGEKAARESASVDFTDMVYLPVHWSMHGSNCFENFSLDWILVDECQDLSPTTLEFWLRLAGATAEGSHPQSHRPLKVGERMTGRLIFVGDRHQAIMGFAGSDDKMIETVKNKTGATELPLSICYRCPSSHLNLVNKIFPDIGIEAETNALFGEICVIPESKLYDKSKTCYLRVRDLVISRKRASLIRLFFDLLKRGVKTRLKGIDFDDIKSTILKINNLQGFGYDNFLEFLEIYKKQHLEKWKNSEALDYLKQDLDDTLSIIKIVYFEFNDCDSVNELCSRLENILKDDKSPLPILMTCHSAKGAESDRVFIYYPQDLPLLWEGQPEWMYAQELNLLYVSLTRSRHSLYLICDEKVLPKDPFWFIEVSKHYSENTIRQSLQSLFPTKLKQEFAVDRKDPQNHEALNIKQLDLFEEKPTASSSEIKRYIKTLSLILMEDFNGKIVRIYDIYKHYRDSQLTKSYRLDEIQSALSELERENMVKISKGDTWDTLVDFRSNKN